MRVNEIFTSIDGEVSGWGQGRLTTFIRFQGCNLNCSYCDTKYAIPKEGGKNLTIQEIIERIPVGCNGITLTGGEPLLQQDIWKLIDRLVELDKKVSIETNGSIYIPQSYIKEEGISWVVDYKLEYAEEGQGVDLLNLKSSDYIKIVVTNKEDFEEAIKVVKRYIGIVKAKIAFSTTRKEDYKWIVEELIRRKLFDVVVNCQIHKYLELK